MSGIWNDTAPNGGNSLTDSLYMNGQYTTGDVAWILFASALVWLMIPGIGYVKGRFSELICRFFYGGLGRRKSSLALIWQSLMCLSIISFEVFNATYLNLFLVVLLGIFAYIFTHSRTLYWQSQEFWNDGCTWRSECR